jgi:hypothetical protein
MQKLNDIASLILIRDYLSTSVENMRIKLSREEIKDIQGKVAAMDHLIIQEALKFNVSEFSAPKNVMTTEYTFQSSEDVEKMDLNKFAVVGPVSYREDGTAYICVPTGPDAPFGVKDIPTVENVVSKSKSKKK